MKFSVKDKKVHRIASQLLDNLSKHMELYVKNVIIPEAEVLDPENGHKIFLLAFSMFGTELIMHAHNSGDEELKKLINAIIVPDLSAELKRRGEKS